MARRRRGAKSPRREDGTDGIDGIDGAWGGARERSEEPTRLLEVESDPERATRLLEGLGPRLACRLTPPWLLRLLRSRGTPRAAQVAALVDALHLMASAHPESSPARARALDRQAVRVAAVRVEATPSAVDPALRDAARRALRRIDPADLSDTDLPQVRELALRVNEHGLALLLWLEEVAADPDGTALARRWMADRLALSEEALSECGLSRGALREALMTLSQHVPAVPEG